MSLPAEGAMMAMLLLILFSPSVCATEDATITLSHTMESSLGTPDSREGDHRSKFGAAMLAFAGTLPHQQLSEMPVAKPPPLASQEEEHTLNEDSETQPFPPTAPMAYIWWLLIFYMFFMMAIVCDDYLVPTVDIMCEEFQIPEDVAGATLMAFACNGPELLTNVCSIFITDSAVGMGTIVGSAIFNVMVIVGVCPLVTATGVLDVPKATFLRDCFFSALSIAILLWALPVIDITKASVLLGMAVVYTVAVAKFDSCFGKVTEEQLEHLESQHSKRLSFQDTGEVLPGQRASKEACSLTPVAEDSTPANMAKDLTPNSKKEFQKRMVDRRHTTPPQGWDPISGIQVDDEPLLVQKQQARTVSRSFVDELIAKSSSQRHRLWRQVPIKEAYTTGPKHREELWEEIEQEMESDPGGRIFKILAAPTTFALHMTVPDVKQHSKRGFYFRAFLLSMAWLSATAWIVCMGSDMINYYWGIPQSFLGLTLTAIGTSFPNMFASMITARTGRGPIAVSNALGSNVQNVFLVMALPIWLRVLQKGEYVMQGNDIMASIIWMAVTLGICIAAIAFKKFQLTSGTGMLFIIVYVVYVVQTTLSST